MLRSILRFAALIIGFIAGYELFYFAVPALAGAAGVHLPFPTAFAFFGGTSSGLILYFIMPSIIDNFIRLSSWADTKLKVVPTQDIVLGGFALLLTLLMGLLLSFPLNRIPWVGPYLSLIVTIGFAYMGVTLVLNRKEEFAFITSLFSRQGKGNQPAGFVKILDTSVIIDGRIVDLCKTGFLEGTLVVPGFVLEELRHIADSQDLLKRNRGRRGLDILNKMQKEMDIPVKIAEEDFEEINEVDSKLVKLAKVLKGSIVTNDFNLNKVCEFQGVQVLNINELANAVKPVVLPGEEMVVHIIKDGKESGQGVAYLDDGTMIVVEGGRRFIGGTIEVLVTSVLQTAAGRMIFAKPKDIAEKISGGVK